MNRRRFLWQMTAVLQGATLSAPVSGLPAADAPAVACGRLPGGLRLRDVAKKKLHHDGSRFTNPFCPTGYRRPLDLLRWKLFSGNRYKHLYPDETERPVDIDWSAIEKHDGLSVTFINHASLMIRDPAGSALVDPIFFGLLPFIHDFSPIAFDVAAMPRPDAVLITHGHYDHLDIPSLKALGPAQRVVAPPGYGSIFDEIGLKDSIFLAIVNLGAYAPRWFMARSHMDPARTVEAFRQLRAKRLMAVHWGAFRLGDEPVHLPPLELAKEMEKVGLADRLVHLSPGQTLRVA